MIKKIFFLASLLVLISCKSKIQLQQEIEPPFYIKKYHEGLRAQLNNNHQKAIECFEACITVSPQNDAPYFGLYKTYSSLNNNQKSHDNIQQAYSLDPDNAHYSEILLESYRAVGDFESAGNLYLKMIEKDPRRSELYFKSIYCFVKTNNLKTAINVLNDWEKINGESPEIFLYKYNVYMSFHKNSEALKLIELGHQKFENNSEILVLLIEHYFKNGEKEKAIQLLEDLIAKNVENEKAALLLGNIYFDQGKQKAAFDLFKIALESDNMEALECADLFLKLKSNWKNNAEIQHLLELKISTFPQDPVLLTILADYYALNQNIILSLENYKRAVVLKPDLQMVWEEIMIIEFELEQWYELSKDAHTYNVLFPFSSVGMYAAGVAEIENKNYDQANNILSEAKEMVLNDALTTEEINGLIGEIEILQGNRETGLKKIKKAINHQDNIFTLERFLNLCISTLHDNKLSDSLCKELCSRLNNKVECLFWQMKTHVSAQRFEESLKMLQDNPEIVENDYRFIELKGDIMQLKGKSALAKQYWKESFQKGNRSDRIQEKIK